ncbi:ABC transporter ATP-binding protein [Paenibacillus aceti]|nr:ABC transporter ATP-binding protein [Paenibacillus aceti]
MMTELDIMAGVQELRLKFPGEESFVFKDLSFSVRRGEKVLLLGPSGCGKSTLLQVLSGIMPELVEVPMKCKERIVPKSRGVLFQDPDTQFCMPYVDEELAFVLENLCVPREEMEPRMRQALEQVGLSFNQLHIPIQSLSQGMKQRLALASVLLADPEVLFLDEPSALLDPEGRKQIWEAIHSIADQRTMVIVEHRIEEMLGLVDSVVLFGPEGQVLGQASPGRLFSAYREELGRFGIWYPGVWEVFFKSHSGQLLLDNQMEDISGLSLEPLIELQQFRGFRQRTTVIEVEQAEVYPGDFIVITGPNGAGKSSLLLSLMGLLPAEGVYRLRGKDMHAAKSGKRRTEQAAQQIGFVFQNPEMQFVADQVSEEIAFSLYEEGYAREDISSLVRQSLRQFGLEGLEHRHPYQLSLGQKRRLSVAGSIVLDKALLLLDEPTFGQDAVNTFAILSLCEELRRRGMAIVMVTHEEKLSDTIATLEWKVADGRLVSTKLTKRGQEMAFKRRVGNRRVAGHE